MRQNIRPYIVINGKDSKNINGLVICNLPPVTKAAQRVSIEETDGRDGDKISCLGYASYDKKITIGLSYGYDIDEVISYFNSSGNITFSSEPDKYYKFVIYEQIDFEKLVRFRTATVTMHVQPFKYSCLENEKIFDLSEDRKAVITNNGNTMSKPIFTFCGAGNADIYLNSKKILHLSEYDFDKTIINVEEMNAYDVRGNLMNRYVYGDYNDLMLSPGSNEIIVDGEIDALKIRDYSRWI